MPHEDFHAAVKLVAELRKISDDSELFQELGKTFTRYVLHEHAKAALDVSLELDPCDGYTHLYLGDWFYGRKQYEAALERFEYAAERMPDEPFCLSCIADVFERQNRLQEAEELHKMAIELDPAGEDAKRRYLKYLARHSK